MHRTQNVGSRLRGLAGPSARTNFSRTGLCLLFQMDAGVDLTRITKQRAQQSHERFRIVAGKIMVRRLVLKSVTRGQGNQSNVITNCANEPQNSFTVNSFALYCNETIGIRKRLKYVQGFFCAVRCKNVELCSFQYELTSRKRLTGFWFRHNHCRTTHTRLDAVGRNKEARVPCASPPHEFQNQILTIKGTTQKRDFDVS